MNGAEREHSSRANLVTEPGAPDASAIQDVSTSMSVASTQPPLDLQGLGQQQWASISSAGQQPSWMGGIRGRLGGGPGVSLDSHASAPMRQPSSSIALPVPTVRTFSQQDSLNTASRSTAVPQAEKTSFLVQQPSSKLWMEAVPMRTGTKATTSYRVYSNAFMEGRNQQPHFEGRPGRSSARTGVPSIKSSAELVNASAVLGPASWARSGGPASSGAAARQDNAPGRGAAPDPASSQHVTAQRQASADIRRQGLAVAERMLERGYVVRPRKEDMGTESQGFVGSAASSAEAIRQRSGSFRGEDSRGGGDADAAATLDQERQLAALLTMQDLAGASLLSSAEARGSSNLVYILRTLQDHGGMHPQRLLQQLQAAAGDSPMQQALLMHLLQESLSLSQQSQAAQRAGSGSSGRDRFRQEGHRDVESPAGLAAAPPSSRPSRRISHEEVEASLRHMESEDELPSSAQQGPRSGSLSRLGREAGNEAMPGNRGPHLPQRHATEHYRKFRGLTFTPAQLKQPTQAVSRLVFKDDPAPDDRQQGMNPFEGLRTQQYEAADRAADSGQAVRMGAPARPSGEPNPFAHEGASNAEQRQEAEAPPEAFAEEPLAEQQPGTAIPGKEGPESLREAAKMLLCLNSQEPVARGEEQGGPALGGDAPPAAAAGTADPPAPPAQDAGAADSATASGVSPLQALVQDIMQKQKQRAQESALAKLPLGVTRLDQRGLDRAAAAAASEEDGVSAPSRKRTARMLNRDFAPAPSGPAQPPAGDAAGGPGLVRHSSGSRLSVLGFAVPSAPRTGHIAQRSAPQPPRQPPRQPCHPGSGAEEGGRHKPEGDTNGGRSEARPPGPRQGAAIPLGPPVARVVSHSLSGRRVTRPVLRESSDDFSDGSSEAARSTDSDSWDNSREPRQRKRRRQ